MVPGQKGEYAPTINEWEGKSRYTESFVATIEDIQTVMSIADDLEAYCNNLVTEEQ